MKSTNWKDIAELVGIAAIVVSLVFVGLQLKQDRVVARIDVDLDRALRKATENVVDFLVDRHQIRPSEAFSIASVAVDFTISEAVDGTQVVTAFVPKSIFRQ